MSFKVIKSGFLASIQDKGRFGHAQHGISQSGVMDEHAYAWANYLLNNDFNDAVIEITIGGLQLQAQDEVIIAITGADLDFKINNKSAALWQSIKIFKGDVLSWGYPKSGVRAYLAVKGGFNTETMFGSKSINLRENIGNKLTADEIIPCQSSSQSSTQSINAQYFPNYNQALVLRLLPSYQFSEFSTAQRDLFFNQNYLISNASDRTGCRLNGLPMALKAQKRISEGMSYGSVEIAGDGLPIILLKDAPTIGGYPKIGTVFSLDLAKLAQRQAHTELRFELISNTQAQSERKAFNEFFNIDYR
ncbi:Allophanate hydrolase 2 subunit 2 [uncultured Candidatus Thioglobus sp.]|nr:Allophanate hydrolase 2 subunit 2 [uncultured Candidatus Thioglobus sp.]